MRPISREQGAGLGWIEVESGRVLHGMKAAVGIAAMALLAELVAAGAAFGDVSQWIAARGGDFFEADHWSNGVPGAGTTARFDLDATYAVDLATQAEVLRLVVGRGAVAFHAVESLAALSTTPMQPSLVIGDIAGETASAELAAGQFTGEFMEVGSVPGATGELTLAPTASLLLDDILSVGPRGNGTVTLDSADLSARRLVLGTLDTGSGAIVQHGGTSSVEETATVGQKGEGTLSLDEAALFSCDELMIALSTLSSGEVSVSGLGTMFTASGVADIGSNGVGTFHVSNGAQAAFGGDVVVGTFPTDFNFPYWPGGDGLLLVEGAGSHVTIAGDLYAPLVGEATIEIGVGGSLAVEGDLLSIQPWDATLAFTLNESSPLLRGPLIEVSGDVNSSPDTFGNGILLAITLADEWEPLPGDSVTLLSANTIDINLDLSTLPALPDGRIWLIVIETNLEGELLILRVASSPDLDGDGLIDGADLGLLIAAWGGSGAGDLNGDGIVDGGDFGILLAAWS